MVTGYAHLDVAMQNLPWTMWHSNTFLVWGFQIEFSLVANQVIVRDVIQNLTRKGIIAYTSIHLCIHMNPVHIAGVLTSGWLANLNFAWRRSCVLVNLIADTCMSINASFYINTLKKIPYSQFIMPHVSQPEIISVKLTENLLNCTFALSFNMEEGIWKESEKKFMVQYVE